MCTTSIRLYRRQNGFANSARRRSAFSSVRSGNSAIPTFPRRNLNSTRRRRRICALRRRQKNCRKIFSKNDSYLISVSDITERHEKQKRANILLEHEKAFRIALQMIAQNKGFDEFSQWLLENLLNWLGADRTQIYRIDQATGKAALAAEYSSSEKKENTVDLIPLNSQFRAALSAPKIIAYDCSKPNENESLDAVCDKLKSLDVKSAAFFGIISNENLSGLISVEFFKKQKKILGIRFRRACQHLENNPNRAGQKRVV